MILGARGGERWADETEAIGVVRDELEIAHVLIVPLPPAAGPTDS
ncbi:hypothetical protein [Candidatus Palauibacter sp.]